MTEKKEFPDLPELPESPESFEEGDEESGMDAYEQTISELGDIDSLAELPAIPEPPPEPPIAPLDYVADAKIVDKMQSLIQQKKDEAEERERLATMPKQPFRRDEPRVGRNDPCPCGSGKKYKKCHMGKDLEE